MDELKEWLVRFLRECRQEKGFVLPVYVTAIGSNGSMLFVRGDDQDSAVLARHSVDAVIAPPINVIVTDSMGDAAHAVLGSERAPVLRVLH